MRDGEVFAAIINSDMAAYMYETMNEDASKEPLSIVKSIEAKIPVKLLSDNINSIPCRTSSRQNAIKNALYKYRKKAPVSKSCNYSITFQSLSSPVFLCKVQVHLL